MTFVKLITTQKEPIIINIDHITWVSDNEVCFYGTAQVTLTKNSLEKLENILLEKRVKLTRPVANRNKI
jgi:hypothetical protein